MLIVIEGPDGAGKSTLIEQLRANSSQYYVIVRSGHPPSLEAHDRFVLGVRALSYIVKPEHVLCDRHQAISERVYTPLLRRVAFNPPGLLRSWEEIDIVVYCRPQVLTILRNSKAQRQMEGVGDSLARIVGAYDQTMAVVEQHTRVIKYDFEATTVDQLKGAIFE